MSENEARHNLEPGFIYDESDALAGDWRYNLYAEERQKAIEAGQPVWKMRNFVFGRGQPNYLVFDFYYLAIHHGYVTGKVDDGYIANRHSTEEEREDGAPEFVRLNIGEPCETRGQAQKELEDYVLETTLG